MNKKIIYIVSLLVALIVIGCENQPVATTNGTSKKISGETHLVESKNFDTVNKIKNGYAQLSQEITVYNDISNNELLSGRRTVEVSSNYIINGEGQSAGSFSLESKIGHWEGDWTGTTTLDGTTIMVVGYNFDDRDQSCEWRYYFPSSLEGKRGTYSANISTNKF